MDLAIGNVEIRPGFVFFALKPLHFEVILVITNMKASFDLYGKAMIRILSFGFILHDRHKEAADK